MRKLLFILLMGILACISQAAVVEYELDCAGIYTRTNSTWTTDFDLDAQFSSISSVSIKWSGGFGAALIVNPATPGQDWQDIGACIDFGTYSGSSRYVSIWGGTAVPPEEEFFDCQTYISGNWDDLLDGIGQLSMGYVGIVAVPEVTIISYGSLALNDSTLVVEGTLVPEPLSIALLSLGSIVALRKRVS